MPGFPGIMAAVIVARRRHRNAQHAQERVFRRRISLFDLSDNDIVRRYRLPGHAIIALLDEIKDDIEPITQRSHAVPGIVKLLSTLQVLASGSFQTPIAGVSGIAQSSVCRAMWEVVPAIIRRVGRHIRFPQNQQDIQETKQDFYQVGGFPNVVGAIDCTHVPLVPPSETENVFRNRKHTHSVNVQAICYAHGIITNVVAKFPGSVHDSFIFRNSAVHRQMQDMDGRWLVGDSGYQLQPWIVTPVRNPVTEGEAANNRAHIRTRGIIERIFGILKSRLRCLDRSGGALLYSPCKVCKVVVVCCILHNIAIRAGVRLGEQEAEAEGEGDSD
ncbi:hypothetical protein SKAU_G00363680 [Synaphobranchus kaupii]|uniref:Putative nuclease HARBI1 n=1 Tax=Synaphobranchus kaupii TaxID=118154 RepID=A0A9Q1EIT9_SYNKA|nr:hypothetical protein SKAU_G00363680 [Synaphobranchus kaupii]